MTVLGLPEWEVLLQLSNKTLDILEITNFVCQFCLSHDQAFLFYLFIYLFIYLLIFFKKVS